MLDITLLFHAAFGAVCLLSGIAAFIAAKRPGRHPLAGRIFVGCLILSYIAIVPNMVYKANLFLIGLGFIAVFSAIEGWRTLLRKQGRIPMTPGTLDYTVVAIAILLSVTLIGLGIRVLSRGNSMALVLLAFGVLGIVLSRATWKRWKTHPSPKELLRAHIGMMCGAFSAALTAFVVQQLEEYAGSQQWVLWIAPSFIMTWVGQRATRRYAPKTQANG